MADTNKIESRFPEGKTHQTAREANYKAAVINGFGGEKRDGTPGQFYWSLLVHFKSTDQFAAMKWAKLNRAWIESQK